MISKITTLSRPAILAKIFQLSSDLSKQTSLGTHEFFDVGLPMTEPFSPTGTIAIVLERNFLHRNKLNFLWGSIPDNGGVKNGFLPHLSRDSYKDIRLNYHNFLRILKKIDALPRGCMEDVFSKRRSASFCSSIRGILKNEVIDGMLESPMQAARRIEFCLNESFQVQDCDVRAVFVPNTYRHLLSRRMARIQQSKIVFYNPRSTVMELFL